MKSDSKPKKNIKNFIYNGDLCFFKEKALVCPANDDWSFNPQISRIIWPGEHVFYMKRLRKKRQGPWMHCIVCYGMKYIFTGSMNSFTKSPNSYQEDSNGY